MHRDADRVHDDEEGDEQHHREHRDAADREHPGDREELLDDGRVIDDVGHHPAAELVLERCRDPSGILGVGELDLERVLQRIRAEIGEREVLLALR